MLEAGTGTWKRKSNIKENCLSFFQDGWGHVGFASIKDGS